MSSRSPRRRNCRKGGARPISPRQGALGGRTFQFNLRQALRRGPVVLYFYPKAFTQGCTLEAHAFAEATDQFRAAGATVVGMSADDLPTLQKFSREACRDKFAVAAATPQVIAAYDVDLKRDGTSTGLTKRTSYVIGARWPGRAGAFGHGLSRSRAPDAGSGAAPARAPLGS